MSELILQRKITYYFRTTIIIIIILSCVKNADITIYCT